MNTKNIPRSALKVHPIARGTALAALATSAIALAPAALAQGKESGSGVQVFGLLDIGVQALKASGTDTRYFVNSDGNTSSRFGVRGTEDLGGGLKVGFWLESAVSVDDGTSGATSTNNKDSVSGGLTWGRRATVQVSGDWGELRLGRDYVPSFGNLTTSMHPFGTNGVGSSGLMFYPVPANGTTARTNVRASNSIGYFTPSGINGFYGHVMVALGEQGPGPTRKDGDLQGVRVGWRNEVFNTSAAISRTRYATGNYTQSNVGATYQWGPAKLMALWGRNEVGITSTTATMLGTQYQLGPGELRFAYTWLKAKNIASDATHIALGYVYDLSKRTALYGNIARIDNKGPAMRFNVGLAATVPGGNSGGVETGVRHSF
ncbi:porin [Roseateles aquatilis]|uniref:porin n=1 Tax=Roseateles aquatilis TaxID=431061 RepID=UPI0013039D4D|nr:porin [Roseateles aquatilis]